MPNRIRTYLHSRQIVAAAVGFLLALALLIPLQLFASNTIAKKRAELLQQQAILLHEINDVPSPTGMVPGISNSQTRFVINQTNEKAESFKETASAMEYPTRYRVLGIFARERGVQGVKLNHSQAISNAVGASEEITSYAELVSSLLLFLEYNPRVDTAGYNPDSSDTKERMDRLANGLSATIDGLNRLDQSSVHMDIIEQIKSTQKIQQDLLDNRDAESFTQAFEAEQAQVIVLLEQHFAELQPQLRQQLIQIAKDLR